MLLEKYVLHTIDNWFITDKSEVKNKVGWSLYNQDSATNQFCKS